MKLHTIPKYSCTTIIEALKIREVHHLIKDGAKIIRIVPEDERFSNFDILNDGSFGRRQDFHPGDYWVRFQDGTTTCMLASTVENSYRPNRFAETIAETMLSKLEKPA